MIDNLMKTAFVLILASLGRLFAEQPAEQIVCTEPAPAKVVGEIPPGWQIIEIKEEKVVNGPFQLPNGQWVTLSTPKYVLQPVQDKEHPSLYLLEPGFDLKDPSGNPRAGTLANILYTEMESLRVSSENLSGISDQIGTLQGYIQQQSGTATVSTAQPIETPTPPLPLGSPPPMPAAASVTPDLLPATPPENSPSPSPAAPARGRPKKMTKKPGEPTATPDEPAATPSPSPKKKRWWDHFNHQS
jgi:hypothetical protein